LQLLLLKLSFFEQNLKNRFRERLPGRASRGGLGAGVGIYQTLSQSQRLAAPQTRQNRAGGDFGVWMGLG